MNRVNSRNDCGHDDSARNTAYPCYVALDRLSLISAIHAAAANSANDVHNRNKIPPFGRHDRTLLDISKCRMCVPDLVDQLPRLTHRLRCITLTRRVRVTFPPSRTNFDRGTPETSNVNAKSPHCEHVTLAMMHPVPDLVLQLTHRRRQNALNVP